MTIPLQAAHVVRGATSRLRSPAPARFCLAELAGRFVELSGEGASSVLTLAVGLVLDAQRQAEPVAWITTDSSTFYPPDVAESGVDLDALVVVRVNVRENVRENGRENVRVNVRENGRVRARGGAHARAHANAAAKAHAQAEPGGRARTHAQLAVAAERLLRSGAFGLVVIDLGKDAGLAQPLQSRLLGLAQRHQSVLLCLTEKHEDTPSLGSLVSLRAQARRTWLAKDRFECELRVLKDKHRGPTWSQREVCRGPLGLR